MQQRLDYVTSILKTEPIDADLTETELVELEEKVAEYAKVIDHR